MKTFKGKSPEHICYYIGILLIVLGLLSAILQATDPFLLERLLPPCFFYYFTHFPCPGCGMTRAIRAFFSMNFITSFRYHPIILYCVFFFSVYMVSHTLELISHHLHGIKLRAVYLYIGIILLLAQWVVKLLFLLFA